MHITEPSVPKTIFDKVKIDTEELKRCKSPGTNQIPAEMMQAGCNTFCSKIQKFLILFEIRKDHLICVKNLLLYLFIKREIKLTINYRGISFLNQLHTKFYPTLFSED
jgi:hypothetical protein